MVTVLGKEAGKKSDQGFDLYKCKTKDQNGNDKAETVIPANELSSSITINIVSMAKGDDGNKVSQVKVNIYEKLIEQLEPVMTLTNSFGTMVYKSKLVDKEDTPISCNMGNLSNLLVLAGGGGGRVQSIKWFRTKYDTVQW